MQTFDLLGQLFLYFTAGVFWGWKTYDFATDFLEKRRVKNNMTAFINRMRTDAAPTLDRLIKEAREQVKKPKGEPVVQTFKWRHGGKINEVKIVIDPDLDSSIPGTSDEFEELIKNGDAGKLEDLLNNIAQPSEKKKMAEVDQFTFSPHSVAQMKLVGMSPDELVVKMLKAAGRMD